MDIELKGKFDDLDDLLSGGYISKEEFAAARENLLIEAGFDVSPRESGFLGGLSFRQRDEGADRSGCGCFLMLLLLVAVLFGGFLALPEGILKDIPVIGNLLAGQGIMEMKQSVTRFIDDLRGNPAPVNGPVSGGNLQEEEFPIEDVIQDEDTDGGDEDKDLASKYRKDSVRKTRRKIKEDKESEDGESEEFDRP